MCKVKTEVTWFSPFLCHQCGANKIFGLNGYHVFKKTNIWTILPTCVLLYAHDFGCTTFTFQISRNYKTSETYTIIDHRAETHSFTKNCILISDHSHSYFFYILFCAVPTCPEYVRKLNKCCILKQIPEIIIHYTVLQLLNSYDKTPYVDAETKPNCLP